MCAIPGQPYIKNASSQLAKTALATSILQDGVEKKKSFLG